MCFLATWHLLLETEYRCKSTLSQRVCPLAELSTREQFCEQVPGSSATLRSLRWWLHVCPVPRWSRTPRLQKAAVSFSDTRWLQKTSVSFPSGTPTTPPRPCFAGFAGRQIWAPWDWHMKLPPSRPRGQSNSGTAFTSSQPPCSFVLCAHYPVDLFCLYSQCASAPLGFHFSEFRDELNLEMNCFMHSTQNSTTYTKKPASIQYWRSCWFISKNGRYLIMATENPLG